MGVNLEEELVSIVIPVYNVEAYIEKCLQSVLNQSYRGIEIIVINDGSPDKSEDIILHLAATDSRIKYLKKENGGLSSARNAGIDIATGDYICFVDSDDWLDENFIKDLLEAIKQDNTDIAICNMTYIYPNGSIKKRTPKIEKKKVVSNIEGLRDLFNGDKFKFHAQNKIYKARLFKEIGIRYPDGKIYEDVFTTYKLFYETRQISYVNKELYFYLQNRPGSILQTRFNNKRFDIFEALDNIESFMVNNNLELKDEFQHLVVINTISLANYIYLIYESLSRDKKKECKRMLCSVRVRYTLKNWIKNDCISFVEKIRYLLLIDSFNVYMRLMKVIKRG